MEENGYKKISGGSRISLGNAISLEGDLEMYLHSKQIVFI